MDITLRKAGQADIEFYQQIGSTLIQGVIDKACKVVIA